MLTHRVERRCGQQITRRTFCTSQQEATSRVASSKCSARANAHNLKRLTHTKASQPAHWVCNTSSEVVSDDGTVRATSSDDAVVLALLILSRFDETHFPLAACFTQLVNLICTTIFLHLVNVIHVVPVRIGTRHLAVLSFGEVHDTCGQRVVVERRTELVAKGNGVDLFLPLLLGHCLIEDRCPATAVTTSTNRRFTELVDDLTSNSSYVTADVLPTGQCGLCRVLTSDSSGSSRLHTSLRDDSLLHVGQVFLRG